MVQVEKRMAVILDAKRWVVNSDMSKYRVVARPPETEREREREERTNRIDKVLVNPYRNKPDESS